MATPKPKTIEKRLHRNTFKTEGGYIVIEGVYTRASIIDPLWRLTHWRCFSQFRGQWATPSAPNGWYLIHHNRKRNLGSLQLLRAIDPTVAPIPEDAYRPEDYETLKRVLTPEVTLHATSNAALMLKVIDANPADETVILAAADTIHEDSGIPYDTAVLIARQRAYTASLTKTH